jgi:hypothetical protein
METNWTTEDARAIAALVDASRRALQLMRWVDDLAPSGIDLALLQEEITALEGAIDEIRRRGMAP